MEIQLWQIIVLGIVQGITEFLPISSDGHLVVVASLLVPGGSVENLEVSDVVIVLHAGTLLSILVFYWHRVWDLLKNDWRSAWLIVVATIPAVIIGLPVKLFAEAWLGDPILAGIFLIVTGLVLVVAHWSVPLHRTYHDLTIGEAVFLGVAQAAAILPGLSRSGCTITSGLRMGMEPRSAATFSFLMAIPAIAGACVLELLSLWKDGGLSTPVSTLAVGVFVAFVVGLGALWWLVTWLERGRFVWFAGWCIPMGVFVLIWHLLGGH